LDASEPVLPAGGSASAWIARRWLLRSVLGAAHNAVVKSMWKAAVLAASGLLE
jgi:hypothetical protein